jgi:histidinol dehydrogenase
MLPILSDQTPGELEALLARLAHEEVSESGEREAKVRALLAEVRSGGDRAVRDLSLRFDGVELEASELRVSEGEIASGAAAVDPRFKEAVKRAIHNLRAFHEKLRITGVAHQGENGEVLESRILPIERAGLYIPGGTGGTTPLVSTLLMNAIPAQVAGVSRVIAATPPRRDKTIHPALLYAFQQTGIREVYRVGGTQAIAAMAFGTETIPAVDIICGPGNAWVTEAKRQVFGRVKIDGIFGHSEIVIIADESANPRWVAADLMSQAEHNGGELSLLLTTSADLARRVNEALAVLQPKAARQEEIAKSFTSRGAILLVSNLEAAVAISNRVAPEHLELHTRKDDELLSKVTAAGAVFVGPWATEPIGDYICGTNHVLPTGGSARFSSPLGVDTFLRRMNVIRYTEKAFRVDAPHAITLADAEGFDAHKGALERRFEL